MNRDYSEEVVVSNLAFRITTYLIKNGESYPTQIAEDLDSSYSSANNYRKGLEERNIIKKTRKEGKKQFYKVNKEGILGLWEEEWLKLMDTIYNVEGHNLWKYHMNQISDKEVESPLELVSTSNWDTMKAFAKNHIKNIEDIEIDDEVNLHLYLVDDFLGSMRRSLEVSKVEEPDHRIHDSVFDEVIQLFSSAYIYKSRHGEESKKTNKDTFSHNIMKAEEHMGNLMSSEELKDM